MQPNNLTKAEYYKQKKLPIISLSHKLESEPPVINHLIQNLPRLITEIEKIQSKQVDSNRTNLELANALKIIHELEFELETITSRFYESEDELLSHQNQSKELSRQIQRNEEIIISLQSTMQKNEFSTKAKFEQEKDYYNSILIQYEKRIEDMNEAYDQLKRDRESELQEAKTFHENSFNKAEARIREYENLSQEDVKKLQKELEKAIDLNGLFRKKITDLETLNQEHIRSLEKANIELAQTNLRIKTEYEHKIMAIQISLDLSENKVKEHLNSIKILESKIENNGIVWMEEKKSMSEQHLENEKIWRNSYNEVNKQKERTLEELNKKTILIGDKEREESNLREKIRNSERLISEYFQEKIKTIEDHERAKKEITETLLLDHHLKIDEIRLENDRFVSQEVKRVIEFERRTFEERYSIEVSKYIEQIKTLENQKLEDSHAVRLSEDCSRKLQVKIDQMNVEIEFLNKHNQELSESFRNQTKTMEEEFQYRMNNEQKRNANDFEKLKSEREMEELRIKERYEVNIKELNGTLELRSNQLRELQNKLRQVENDYTNEKANLVGRVQEFEISIGKYKSSNEGLMKEIKKFEERSNQFENECIFYERRVQEEVNARNRFSQELNTQNENYKRFKDEELEKEKERTKVIKSLETDLLEQKRKNSAFSIDIERLNKIVADLQFKYESANKELKSLEQEKYGLQKKLVDKDTSFEEKWKEIKTYFEDIEKKKITECEGRENDYRSTIRLKEEVIEQQTKIIKDLEEAVDHERNVGENLNYTWQIKYRELEDANKTLIKSSFNMQDLEKENIGKDLALKNLTKDIEKYRNEIDEKTKYINKMNAASVELGGLVNNLNFDNENLKNSLTKLENLYKNLERDFETYRQKNEVELSNLRQSESNKFHNLQRLEIDFKLVSKRLEEALTANKKLSEEKLKNEEKTAILQRELEETARLLKEQKINSLNAISELEIVRNELQLKIRTTGEQLKEQSREHEIIIEKQKKQLKRFTEMLEEYETNFAQKMDELERAKKNLENERMTSSSTKFEIEQLKKERFDLEQKIESLYHESKFLKNEKLTIEGKLNLVYEENNKRIQENEEILKRHYESLLSKKAEEIKSLQFKFSQFSQKEKEEFTQREANFKEEKEKFIIEISQRNEEIIHLKIKYESVYEEVCKKEKELEMYRSKWAHMFDNVKSANDSLVKAEREGEQSRIFRTEVKTEIVSRTERIERTEKSTNAFRTGEECKYTPSTEPKQQTNFKPNLYSKLVFDVDMNTNEAFEASRNFHKEKEEQNGKSASKENFSIYANSCESRYEKEEKN